MRNRLPFLLIFCFFHGLLPQSAVTYAANSGGRLGNQLFKYMKTKWIANQYNLPLYHKPFPMSDNFIFHSKEQHFSEELLPYFDEVILIKNLKSLKLLEANEKSSHPKSILYEVHLHAEIKNWNHIIYNENNQYSDFISLIKQMIQPSGELKKPFIPLGYKSVACHVRRGGGFDKTIASGGFGTYASHGHKYEDFRNPKGFPPNQFFIDSIKHLHTLLGQSPLYIFIFTDDPNPEKIAQSIRNQLSGYNIIIDSRKNDQKYTNNTVEDLFSMISFDYLIRATSDFSKIALVLGDHKIVIAPNQAHWSNEKNIIDSTLVKKRDKKGLWKKAEYF